jgi:AhpD family alkylhydroperoxidase
MFNMKKLSRLKKENESAFDAMKTFVTFNEMTFADGALTAQQKQLIAVGAALIAQCPYCIELHTNAAREAGASDAQVSEAALVAAAVRTRKSEQCI